MTERTLELASQLDTLKLLLLVIGIATTVLGGITLQLLRNARATKQETNERIARRESAEADKQRSQQEAENKRYEAFLGLFSQLSSQSEVLMTVHQQTVGVLEKTENGRTALVNVLDANATTFKRYADELQEYGRQLVRANQLGADQLSQLNQNTLAIRDAAETNRLTAQQLRKDLLTDATHWVDGIKAELGGDRAIIAGLPERFAAIERVIGQLQDRIGDMPLAIAAKITEDIQAIRELTAIMVEKLDTMNGRIENFVKTKEGSNGTVEVTQVSVGAGGDAGAGSSAGNP